MNDNPHLMAILDSKLSQVRLNLQHDNFAKADDLLSQIKIYAEALHVEAAAVRH